MHMGYSQFRTCTPKFILVFSFFLTFCIPNVTKPCTISLFHKSCEFISRLNTCSTREPDRKSILCLFFFSFSFDLGNYSFDLGN